MSGTIAVLAAHTAQASVEISSKPTANMTCANGVCAPTAQKAVLNVNDLAGMLTSSDVSVKSDGVAQDIELKASLSWASSHRLTLDSYRALAMFRALAVTGTGALSLMTNDGGTSGDLLFFGKGHVEFWDTASELTINGNRYVLAKNIQQIANQFKSGVSFVALAGSVDASGNQYDHAPIGHLRATFEGLGNRIANLKIQEGGSSKNAALFSRVSAKGVIRDLSIDVADILGNGQVDQLVGILAGNNDGTIVNVHATGKVTLTGQHSTAGGLVGESDGSIIRCSANVNVVGTDESITLGGLVGINYPFDPSPMSVVERFSTGTVSAQREDGTDVFVGGLVGEAVGGNISNSYSRAAVSVAGTANLFTGGFIGKADAAFTPPLAISNSYSTGAVNSTIDGWTGGFIGEAADKPVITDNYWDLDTSGIDDPSQGAGNIPNEPGITGLTTAQFQSGLPSGFNKKVWRRNAKINDGYPYLVDNPPQ